MQIWLDLFRPVQYILFISENNVKLANDIDKAVDQEDSVLSEVNNSFDVVNGKVKNMADAVSTIHDKASIFVKTKNSVLDEVMTVFDDFTFKRKFYQLHR